jgi:thiosulfate reductase cytochrome b subunit
MQPTERIYLTATPIRIWHWVNALAIVTLCATGAQIRFPEYVNLFGTYKGAIRLHNTAGIVASLSFLLWLAYYLVFARTLLKIYLPTVDDLTRGLVRQAKFYFWFYFFGGTPNPHETTPDNKFNPLQKTAYAVLMIVLVPLIIVSGVGLLNFAPLRGWIMAVGGIKLLAGAHYLIACAFCAFVFTHAYLATLGHTPLAHFKPMWTGWEEVEHHA